MNAKTQARTFRQADDNDNGDKKMTARVSIRAVINDGNMGHGWADNYEAACAYAEFMESEFRRAIEDIAQDTEIDVDVNRNTSGWTPEPRVICDDVETEIRVQNRIDGLRTWEKWLDSADAVQYFSGE